MAGVAELNTIWRNIREVDLQSFRDEALRQVRLALVGAPGSGRHILADHLRRDSSRPGLYAASPVLILDLEEAQKPFQADVIILMLDATRREFATEMALASLWSNQGRKVLVFFNTDQQAGSAGTSRDWSAVRILLGSADDVQFLNTTLVPIVMELLPDNLLGLGRQFPLFRVPIAQHLIHETCFANTTYALGTGLAEVVPALNLPLTLADMVVLTKSQAFLVYKLGLAFGFSLEWRDYLAEFGSVIGGGFVWRQLARSLVGLIPVVGIIPKIAVSYSGTYVVGNAILQWYLTGRHLSAPQMKALSVQAFRRGQDIARQLIAKVRRPRLEAGKKKAKGEQLPSGLPAEVPLQLTDGTSPGTAASAAASLTRRKHLGWGKKDKLGRVVSTSEQPTRKPAQKPKRKKGKGADQEETKLCLQCGKPNALDANFCQYCAAPFDALPSNQDTH